MSSVHTSGAGIDGAASPESSQEGKRPPWWFQRGSGSWPPVPWAEKAARGLVIGQAIIVTLLLVPGSFFGDDFRESSRAAVDPWSSETIIGFDRLRHFSPVTRIFFAGLNDLAPLNHTVALVISSVLLAVMTYLFWRLLKATIGANVLALAALVSFLISPLIFSVDEWLSQAIVTFPVMIGGFIAAHGLVRYLKTPSTSCLVEISIGYILALLTWEKALLIPVVLVAFTIVMTPENRRLMWKPMKATAKIWIVLFCWTAAYLAIWLVGGFGTDSPAPELAGVANGIVRSISELLVPSLFGGPWDWYAASEKTFYPVAAPATIGAVVSAVLLAIMLTLAWRRSWKSVVRTTLFALLVAIASITLPLIGRFGQFGISVAFEPRYILDALPWVLLSFAILANKVLPPFAQWSRGVRTSFVTLLAVVLLGAVVSDARLLSRWWSNPTSDYLTTSITNLKALPAGTELYDSEVPPQVLDRYYFWPFNTTALLFRPVTRQNQVQFGGQDSAAMMTPTGDIVKAGFVTTRELPLLGCVKLTPAGTVIDVPYQYHQSNLSLKLTTNSNAASTVRIQSAKQNESFWDFYATGTESPDIPVVGENFSTQYILTPPHSFDKIRISGPETGACVAKLAIGAPAQVK